MQRTEVTRDANLKEWAKAHAIECLRRAYSLEKENIFSEEASILHAEAIQTLREAGLSLASLQCQ